MTSSEFSDIVKSDTVNPISHTNVYYALEVVFELIGRVIWVLELRIICTLTLFFWLPSWGTNLGTPRWWRKKQMVIY